MARFIDSSATIEVDLGSCQCPGTPHDRDWAAIRCFMSGIDMLAIASAAGDSELQMVRLLNRGVQTWNLTDEDGKQVAISPETISRLDMATVELLSTEIDKQFENNQLPNGSGGRSPAGRRAKTSRTPKIQTRTKPTAS